MSDYSLLRFLILMLVVNLGLGMFDAAVYSYNPAYNGTIDFDSSPAAAYLNNNSLDSGFVVNTSDVLPESADSLNPETGNTFTDGWRTIKNWFSKEDSKKGILKSILSQPYGFLKDIGLPEYIAASFGVIWYLTMLILLIGFIRGGSA